MILKTSKKTYLKKFECSFHITSISILHIEIKLRCFRWEVVSDWLIVLVLTGEGQMRLYHYIGTISTAFTKVLVL